MGNKEVLDKIKAFTHSSLSNPTPPPPLTPKFLSSIEDSYLRLLCEGLDEEKVIPLLQANPQLINSNPKNLILDFFYNYVVKMKQLPLNAIEQKKIEIIFTSLLSYYHRSDLKSSRFFSTSSSPPPFTPLNILEKCFVNIEDSSNFEFCKNLLTPFIQINTDFLTKLYSDYLRLEALLPPPQLQAHRDKILKALERVKEHTPIRDFLDQRLLAHIFLTNGELCKKIPSYEEAPLFSLLPKVITLHGFGRKIEERVSKGAGYGTCLLALCIVRSNNSELLNFLLPYVHYNYKKAKQDITQYYRNHYGHQWTGAATMFDSMGEEACQAIVDKYFLSHYTPPAKAGRTIKI